MKAIVAGIVCALTALILPPRLAAQAAPSFLREGAHAPQGIVSDWTHRHVLYPDSKDDSVMRRIQTDPRWTQNWYLRHQEVWWLGHHHHRHHRRPSHRDWSVPLSANPQRASFEPLFDFSYAIGTDTGNGVLTTTDNNNGQFLATDGFINVVSTLTGTYTGTYQLYPGGPGPTKSPTNSFTFDNLLYPSVNPLLDHYGLLFTGFGLEMNLFWQTSSNNYEFTDFSRLGYTNDAIGGPFTLTAAPGWGQTTPAKFVFDVNAAPSCANDFVVIGIPSTPSVGGQANLLGVNNLYSGVAGALCSTGPTVTFAYASGTGQVPASVAISLNGTQLAYIENRTSGSSYFHVLTIGTTGTNGTIASSAVKPGAAGGNNAVDQSVLLSPDGGITNQGSTNAPWVAYTHGDANDVAYATTYSTSGTGYLYKISNVFNGSAPTIVWNIPINAVPSTPVYDSVSNKIFFTDSNGRIDYVVDSGPLPSVVYGSVLASGVTSENPVVVDSTNEMVYATFNTNGTNSLVVQAPTSMVSTVSVPVGTGNAIYSSPYEPDFNNAWYTGSGTPLLYIAGTGTGMLPTLYSVGFSGSILNSSADATTAALASGNADSTAVTEFYNATLQKDYLFVGVTNNCIASTNGGTAGCVMSLDITNGFPTVNAGSTALAAAGGTSAIIVDNDSGFTAASSIYYATKTGATLVKATQSALN